jgi:hypothetical protein
VALPLVLLLVEETEVFERPLVLPGLLTREVEACKAADWLLEAPAEDVTVALPSADPPLDVPPLEEEELAPEEPPLLGFPFEVTTRLMALFPEL